MSWSSEPSGHKAQSGLTLVELLISITLGLIITLAVGYLYTNSRHNYRMNDNIARIQENGRYALEVIGRDLRMVGYWGCASGMIRSPVITVLGDHAYDFDYPIFGHEATHVNVWMPLLPQSIAGTVLPSTDVLTVRRVFGNAVRVLRHPWSNPPGSAALQVAAGSGLERGDIVLVSDCVSAAVFQITQINTASGYDNLVHATGNTGVEPGNFTTRLGKEYEGGEIRRIATVTYYIRRNAAGRPALYRLSQGNAEEVVENVENMQITYGIDLDGDWLVDEYRTADGVQPWQNWSNVRSVRVRLLLVSPDDNLTDSPQIYTFHDRDGDGIPDPVRASDRRLRYVFTMTAGLRNRLP